MGEFRNSREICPYCWLPGVPILYGYPGPGAQELMHIGRAVGGGCVIDSAMPTMSCPRHHRWRPAEQGVALPARGADALEDFVIAAARSYLSGDLPRTERAYREAIGLVGDSLGSSHVETLLLRHALAIVLYADGRTAEGEAEYRAMWASAGRPLRANAVPTADDIGRMLLEAEGARRLERLRATQAEERPKFPGDEEAG